MLACRSRPLPCELLLAAELLAVLKSNADCLSGAFFSSDDMGRAEDGAPDLMDARCFPMIGKRGNPLQSSKRGGEPSALAPGAR